MARSVVYAPELLSLKRSLEALLGAEWLEGPKNDAHPATVRVRLVERFMQAQMPYPRDAPYLHLYALLMLEGRMLAATSGGNAMTLRFGDYSRYGESALRRLDEELKDRRKFHDCLTELVHAGWHQSLGHFVDPTPEEGHADLEVSMPDGSGRLVIECKRRAGGGDGLRKVLNKAALQLRARIGARELPGIVLLDASDRVHHVHYLASDSLTRLPAPRAILLFEGQVEEILSNTDGVVTAAAIVWVEVVMRHMGDDSFKLTASRRCRLLRHPDPRRAFPDAFFELYERELAGASSVLRPTQHEAYLEEFEAMREQRRHQGLGLWVPKEM